MLKRHFSQGCIFTVAKSAVQKRILWLVTAQTLTIAIHWCRISINELTDRAHGLCVRYCVFSLCFSLSYFFITFICFWFLLKLLYYRLVARSQRKLLKLFLMRVTVLFIAFAPLIWGTQWRHFLVTETAWGSRVDNAATFIK